MTPMTQPPAMRDDPAAFLVAAADAIRDLAANDLTPGRWEVRVTPSDVANEDDTVWIACEDGSTVAVVGEAYTSAPRDAAWIAALSPQVAADPMERMLRQSAYELAGLWGYLEPGSPRLILHVNEAGQHDGSTSTAVWTAEQRWAAIQKRFGGALDLAQRVLRQLGHTRKDEPLELMDYLLVDKARTLAEKAHAGQVDKAGEPYVGHLERVADDVATRTVFVGLAQAVAWLHDIIEDTHVTAYDLTAAGMPQDVVDAVEAITHRPNEPRAEYYARVRSNDLALAVKLADIADNADPARLARLDDQTRERLEVKYAAARDALTASHGHDGGRP